MNHYPNFSAYGYQIERQLGQNNNSGRITYKAIDLETNLPVIIKEFQFAEVNSNWSQYDSFCAEKEILSQLEHPNIPKYLNCFETATGFCLVREYKRGIPLTCELELTPGQIKTIALEILLILIYLQQQERSLVHRDIKPENILVNYDRGKLEVYLIDFGSATQVGQLSDDNIVRGTLGFMPPEQTLNRAASFATDLYSLGITLICLLTGTKSTDVGDLIDDRYRVSLQSLDRQLSPQFLSFLKKMTDPKQELRYQNALAAYSALISIDPLKTAISVSRDKQNLTEKFALVAFAAGILGAIGTVLPYTCSFQSQTSSTSIAPEYVPSPAEVGSTDGFATEWFESDVIAVTEDACSDLTGSGRYKGYIGGGSIITENISCASALDNCQLNASNNPDIEVRCLWNGVEIYNRSRFN
ncbi:MAG: serine/threonine protein kinase [Prochloraceae cyanobacterium]